MVRRARRWRSFKQFVESDLNSESLCDGTRFMALAGTVSAVVGLLLGSVLLEISAAIFLILGAGFFLFLLRWFLQLSP